MPKPKPLAGIGLPLPVAYRTVIGSIVAHWGFFESDLSAFLEALRRAPNIKALRSTVPLSFKKRMSLLQDSIKIGYKFCPSLAEKLVSLVGEAKQLADDRNLIAHGRWGVAGRDISVYAIHPSAGDLRHEKYDLDDLKLIRHKISNLHWRYQIHTQGWFWPNRQIVEKFLTSEEIRALQELARRNRPPAPIFRSSVPLPGASRE